MRTACGSNLFHGSWEQATGSPACRRAISACLLSNVTPLIEKLSGGARCSSKARARRRPRVAEDVEEAVEGSGGGLDEEERPRGVRAAAAAVVGVARDAAAARRTSAGGTVAVELRRLAQSRTAAAAAAQPRQQLRPAARERMMIG
jgi:hypothetical protein